MEPSPPSHLYDQPRAPNPRRVNIFVAEKGIDLPRRTVDIMAGGHQTPAYLAEVGAPVVPALVLADGGVITETQAICRYLEALHPEPNLMGRDAREVAEIEMWQRRVEFGLYATVVHAFRHTNPHMARLEQQCADWGAMNRDRLPAALAALDTALAGRAYLAADRPTVADITALVALDFLRILRVTLPDGLDALAAYAARLRARPAFALET